MQIYYNKDNIRKNYLSAYVKYFVDKNSVLFVNTLYDTKFELTTDEDNINRLICSLKEGVFLESLLDILKNITDKYEELFVYMMQCGIIE